MSEWGSWLKLFREIKSCQCTQSPDKHILKDLGILLLYVCCVSTHLPHLLQMKLAPYSFPYFSSPSYCTFHKIFCILLIIVLCHLIIPFFPLQAYVHIASSYSWTAEVQLFIRCSVLKRCHYSTFSSLPAIKFCKGVQIPSFSCKCMP